MTPTRLLALLMAALAAGCTTPPREDQPLEAASIEGAITIGDAFVLEDARLSVSPRNQAAEGTSGRAVPLADPPWIARTALLRDHWVLEGTLRERAPGTGAGTHRVRLDWNGELAGSLYLEGVNASKPLRATVRFDLGPEIPRSNVYAFEIARVP